MAEHKPPVIFLTGPTASGKTGIAIELASRFPVDLISVDSGMIYREMDIGTAKPSAQELAKAPHALIDILDPTERWSAQEFRIAALDLIRKSHEQQRVPLLVGGTFLYFRALEQGLDELPAADSEIRESLQADWANLGPQAMHQRLQRVDAATANRLHANDRQRVLRALEVSIAAGQPMSELVGSSAAAFPFELTHISLIPQDRAWLHERIAARTDQMFQAGLVDEVRNLWQRWNLTNEHNAARCVGYRQVHDALSGVFSLEEAQQRVLFATRQYAKRQLTWLRSLDIERIFDPQDRNLRKKAVEFLVEKTLT